MKFAQSLKGEHQIAFLIMLNALVWTLWKIRNEICFQQKQKKSFKTVILLIISLITYWLGNVKRQSKYLVPLWMPFDLDEIPLQVWYPTEEDLQMMVYQGPSEDFDGSFAEPYWSNNFSYLCSCHVFFVLLANYISLPYYLLLLRQFI